MEADIRGRAIRIFAAGLGRSNDCRGETQLALRPQSVAGRKSARVDRRRLRRIYSRAKIPQRVFFEILGSIIDIETFARGSSIRELPRLRKLYGEGRW